MKKIRIAQIGVNRYSHALSVFNSLKTQPDIFEIVGYCLVEGEKERFEKELFVFNGYPELTLEEILNDPTIEAVTVETEEIHLTKYAIMAAEHGKMIHMEKPGGTSLEEFEKLISLVKEKNLIFHTGYMYRYNPTIREVIDNAKNGVYGDIVSVEAQMNGYGGAQMRQWLEAFPGGMMFYLGCHLVDLILTIKGLPEKVHDIGDIIRVKDERLNVDIMTQVMAYEYDCITGRYASLEFGNYKNNLSSALARFVRAVK